ncbi:hypothetical protein PIB30_062858 [Stylosanthes scabra]|uniref:NB-ARC domain-containing protein n=1 Tax=Stylosanthes scabra TaxID=79078 RepID=A0ABU6ZK13_9FABA|nr:hypothetical protein [Stylosanthes scabra]
MGGIGKTTIAAAIFKEFSPKFSMLRRKKVFIVLDDVHTSELLETLLGVGLDYLGFGSKVIVTTRNKHVLHGRVIEDHIHEVKEMNFENSLKLFNLNAFNELHPPKDQFWDLSMIAVQYASGIPLALKVLGSFLRSKTYNEWESALAKLKAIPNGDIQQEMGHKIVNEESIKNPGGRSRLWKSEEVRDILKNDKGTDAIETIFLDMTQDTDLCISSQAFRKMPNLR